MFLFDIFVVLVLIYILVMLYSHKDEILKNLETFTNIKPKDLEETIILNNTNDMNHVKKYTRYLNPLTSNMFQKNN